MSYISTFGENYDKVITNILSYRISQLQNLLNNNFRL